MNVFKKSIGATLSFGAGYSLFSDVWEENSIHLNTKKIKEQDQTALTSLINNPTFQKFETNQTFSSFQKSTLVPKSHHSNHAPLGLLFGPGKLAIDPIGFQNAEKDELYIFFHLGSNLKNFNNEIHNGLIATLLDESLCFCGFNKLPSKRGVTGKLSIDFINKIEPNSNILISTKIKELKGRKCVIEGNVKQLSSNGSEKIVTTAECILIEPKWFKYLNWVPAF